MIEVLSKRQQEKMRAIGKIAALTLAHVGERIAAGISTRDIDDWVREDSARRGAKPSQLGYNGFPAAVCTSVNDVVCHGIPSSTVVLRDGDLLNVDVTSNRAGFHGDTNRTFFIGRPSAEARHLVETTERAMWAGIEQVRPGVRLGEIGAAIEALATRNGCTVVRDFGGHGIGRKMHQAPHVNHFGGTRGPRLVEGMAFTIEPMLNLGGAEVRVLDDGWTVVTSDGQLSAQFEHTVLVQSDGAEVLTRS